MSANIARAAELCGIINEDTTFPRVDPKIKSSNWKTIRSHPAFVAYVDKVADEMYAQKEPEFKGMNAALKNKLKAKVRIAVISGLKALNDSNQVFVLDMRQPDGVLVTDKPEVRNLVDDAVGDFLAAERTMQRAKSAVASRKYDEAKVEQWIKDGIEQGIINETMAAQIDKALFVQKKERLTEGYVSIEDIEAEDLSDGIYDISGLETLYVSWDDDESKQSEIDAFLKKHPNAVVAKPYSGGGDDDNAILVSARPKPIKTIEGHVGQGAALIINNAPSKILITAEND